MAVPLAGAKVKAADLLGIFPGNTDSWTAYTPTLTQGATPSKTVEYAGWMKTGRLVTVALSLAMTATTPGTAANAVIIGLPSAAGTPVTFRSLGSAGIFDSSASLWYTGLAVW